MTTWLATHRGLRALSGRETARVLKLWTQTIAAPILSSSLFVVVFGLSLGERIHDIGGFPYDQYIVPGLIAMSMAQAAYANNSSSVFQARFDRYINDVLASPMRAWEVNLGLTLGGAVRALLIGVGVGVYAESWDQSAFVTNLVILPLSFLGGVFYSVGRLPSPWQEISHANPLYYLIDAVRHGFLGESDVPVGISLAVAALLAAACVAWSAWLFATGRRLKP